MNNIAYQKSPSFLSIVEDINILNNNMGRIAPGSRNNYARSSVSVAAKKAPKPAFKRTNKLAKRPVIATIFFLKDYLIYLLFSFMIAGNVPTREQLTKLMPSYRLVALLIKYFRADDSELNILVRSYHARQKTLECKDKYYSLGIFAHFICWLCPEFVETSHRSSLTIPCLPFLFVSSKQTVSTKEIYTNTRLCVENFEQFLKSKDDQYEVFFFFSLFYCCSFDYVFPSKKEGSLLNIYDRAIQQSTGKFPTIQELDVVLDYNWDLFETTSQITEICCNFRSKEPAPTTTTTTTTTAMTMSPTAATLTTLTTYDDDVKEFLDKSLTNNDITNDLNCLFSLAAAECYKMII